MIESTNQSNRIYPSFGVPIEDPIDESFPSSLTETIIKTITLSDSHRNRLIFKPIKSHPEAPKLGEYSSTDIRVSNHVTESLEWKKELINSAKQSIDISANFAGGENFIEVLILIEKRMNLESDLKVHLLLSKDLLTEQDIKYLTLLQNHYLNFHYLLTDRIYRIKPEFLSEENHVKLLIVDGKYFIMGGSGIHERMTREEVPVQNDEKKTLGSALVDSTFRDTDVIGYGKIALTMRDEFFNLYRIWEYRMTGNNKNHFFPLNEENLGTSQLFHQPEGLITDTLIKFIVGGPEHRKENPISCEIARLISKAEKEVRIANLIFNPDDTIIKSLKECKERNVSIRGYLNGTDSSKAHYLFTLPNRINYDLLTDVFEYGKKDQLYHKKVTTIDGQFTAVGSFNLGIKSAKCDYETLCVINDPRITALMNEALDQDAKNSRHYNGDNLKTKQLSKFSGKIVSGFLGNFFG